MTSRLLAGRVVSRIQLATPPSLHSAFLPRQHHTTLHNTRVRHFFLGRIWRNLSSTNGKPQPVPPRPSPHEEEHESQVSPEGQPPITVGPAGYAGGNPFTTGSTVLDAALTTVIGLGMGTRLLIGNLSTKLTQIYQCSLAVWPMLHGTRRMY